MKPPVAIMGLAAAMTISASCIVSGSAAGATNAACSAMSTPALRAINPSSGVSVISTDPSVVQQARNNGYSDVRGEAFAVATAAGSGLTEYRLLTRATSKDQILLARGAEYDGAVNRYGYTDTGRAFYASATASSCLVPVYRLLKGSVHRYTADTGEVTSLTKAGWSSEGTRFYAVPASAQTPTTSSFSVALIPDTQQAAQSAAFGVKPNRFDDAMSNVVRQKDSLDLRYAIAVGDLVNFTRSANGVWDDGSTTPNSQLKVAKQALAKLTAAGIAFSLAMGNHDGGAQCGSGAACTAFEPTVSTATKIRNSSAFNRVFGYQNFIANGGDAYRDPGTAANGVYWGATGKKTDNSYQRFTADGFTFLVLSLEFDPRQGTVDWARSVISSHPRDNVILVTHHYLAPDGTHSDGASDYMSKGVGAGVGPNAIYGQLVEPYSNVIMTASGHVDSFAYSVDTPHGNVANFGVDAAGGAIPVVVATFTVSPNSGTATISSAWTAPAGQYSDQTWTPTRTTVTLVR